MKRAFFIVVVALLPSCANSKNPLSDPDEAKLDAQLLGVWEMRPPFGAKPDEGQYAFAFIGRSPQLDDPPGLMKAVMINNNAENEILVKDFFFFASTFNGRSFINFIDDAVFNREKYPTWSKSNISAYTFAEYTINGDNLEMRFMDTKSCATAIRKGLLKGTVQKGLLNSDAITITASSEELRHFIGTDKEKRLFPVKNDFLFRKVE